MKNLWSIVAQSSSIDKDNNTLSIFDILEEITFQIQGPTPEQIVFPVNFQLISLWERESAGKPIEQKIKFVLKDPSGKTLSQNEGLLKMESHHKRTRFKAQFQGLPATGPGTYKYEIVSLETKKNEEEVLSSTTFEVKIINQPVKSPLKL